MLTPFEHVERCSYREIVQKGAFNQLAKERKGVFSNLLGTQIEVSL